MSCRCRTGRRPPGSLGGAIHSRVRSAGWVGAGIEEVAGFQACEGFAGGEPGPARRVASEERSRPATSSASRALRTSAGSQRCALAVASSSGAARRMCGSRIRRSSRSSSSSSGGAGGACAVAVMAGPDPRRAARRCVRRCAGPNHAALPAGADAGEGRGRSRRAACPGVGVGRASRRVRRSASPTRAVPRQRRRSAGRARRRRRLVSMLGAGLRTASSGHRLIAGHPPRGHRTRPSRRCPGPGCGPRPPAARPAARSAVAGLVGQDRGEVALGRTGPWPRPGPSAQSTAAAPCSAARSTASAILARILRRPPRRPRSATTPRRHRAPGTPPRCGLRSRRPRPAALRPAGGKCASSTRGVPGVVRVGGGRPRPGRPSPTCTITICSRRGGAPTPSHRPAGAAPSTGRARS